MSPRTAALLIGIIFIAVGLLGFVDNPIVGASDTAMFHADKTHNIVHIVSGVLFVLIALAAPGASAGFLILFGLVYLAIGIIGFVTKGADGMATVLGFLHVNNNDNYLHIVLGIVIFLAGVATRRRRVAV
jgi:Domain of unknown function (DUF4383)